MKKTKFASLKGVFSTHRSHARVFPVLQDSSNGGNVHTGTVTSDSDSEGGVAVCLGEDANHLKQNL